MNFFKYEKDVFCHLGSFFVNVFSNREIYEKGFFSGGKKYFVSVTGQIDVF